MNSVITPIHQTASCGASRSSPETGGFFARSPFCTTFTNYTGRHSSQAALGYRVLHQQLPPGTKMHCSHQRCCIISKRHGRLMFTVSFYPVPPFFPAGSESCSSVGSSSSSLSRPQLPLPPSVPSWSNIASTPLIHPAADPRGPAPPEIIKGVPSQPPSVADATNYFVLPLDASGIPPGSVLVSPHTGG